MIGKIDVWNVESEELSGGPVPDAREAFTLELPVATDAT